MHIAHSDLKKNEGNNTEKVKSSQNKPNQICSRFM